MGLDMYLYRKHYVGNKWRKSEDQVKVLLPETQKDAIIKVEGIKAERISEITEEVGYWRKANAIHAWFVREVQSDVDDCKDYYVEREKLVELLGICEKVLASSKLLDGKINNGKKYNPETKVWEGILQDGKYVENPSVAMQLLPTQKGFFFGGYDYDEFYWSDIENTRDMLKAILDEGGSGDFYYHSSW